jgi:hypothetical protein
MDDSAVFDNLLLKANVLSRKRNSKSILMIKLPESRLEFASELLVFVNQSVDLLFPLLRLLRSTVVLIEFLIEEISLFGQITNILLVLNA